MRARIQWTIVQILWQNAQREASILRALESILELSRDPVLALSDGQLVMMNAAAKQAFPGSRIGDSASALVPDAILFEPSDRFVSGMTVGVERYTVAAARCDGVLYLALTPDAGAQDNRGFVSEVMMSGLLSTLYNIGLAADRIHDSITPENKSARESLAMLHHGYYTLLRRLNNLNTLCALCDGSMGLSMRRFDLVRLCEDVVSTTAALTRDDYAPLVFCTELETLPVCMDGPRVEQLILNLLSNSLRYAPKDGCVRLKLAKSGANALISVSDNGSGIDPALLQSVFSGFQGSMDLRLLSAQPGGGIGLALCRVIAERHGGTLILESRPGEGTEVRALLPLSPPDAEQFESAGPAYANGGMPVILTELSDLLHADTYADFACE